MNSLKYGLIMKLFQTEQYKRHIVKFRVVLKMTKVPLIINRVHGSIYTQCPEKTENTLLFIITLKVFNELIKYSEDVN